MEYRTILLWALFAGAVAGPIAYENIRNCARECESGGIKKFNYREGRTYIYDYEISTTTSLQSAGSDSSSFKLKATVEIGRISACEFILRMKDVRVEDESRSKQQEIKEELERNPLRFAYDDGRIDNICPSDDDSKWTLNMKRGVLSAFQNSMESLEGNTNVQETDIAGECTSSYTVSKQGGWFKDLTIIKTKNLRSCTNRNSNKTSIPSTPYWIKSDFQNLPVMDCDHTCEHVIKDNIIKSITCDETHTFKPFARQKSGAVTKAMLKMVFVKEETERTALDRISKRSSLLFDHSYDDSEKEENREEKVIKILEEICRETKEDVTERTPQLFINLVREMRSNDLRALQNINKRLRNTCPSNEEKMKKYFKDALVMCSTPAAVEMMVNKIVSKEVDRVEAEGWVLSFSFIQPVNRRMLTAAKNLLDTSEPSSTAILSVSVLVHNFVRHNPRNMKEPEVVSIIEALEKRLGYKCKSSNEVEEEKVIITLKALGNIGSDLNSIHQCYKEFGNPLEVRLAAIEALRLVNTTSERVLPLVEIFENPEENSELRIAAYLVAMNSANRKIVDRVKSVLEKEKVTQVTSFVWTHLTNVRDSSSPSLDSLQEIIEEVIDDVKLSRQYAMDGRKYSQFIEKSLFSHTLNAGGHVSGKVVFDNSYVPRSASADMSVELFGNHINLFGVGVRAVNLEHPIESLFGPEGYFPQNTIHDIIKSVRRKTNDNRKKRAADKYNRLELFHERFGAKRGEPEGSAYFRLFDNDVLVSSFSGMNDLKSIQDKLNAFDILIELSKDKDIDYSKNVIFLESTHVTPCLGGLPIKLSVNGTASLNLKISGKADVRKLLAAPHSCHIEGKIQPSAAIQISAMMGIDSHTHQNGIKIRSILSTSFVLDGKLAVRDGEVFESYLSVPRDKMEILKISSEVYVVDRHQEKSQHNLERKRVSREFCTRMGNWIDAELCLRGSLVNTFSQSDAPHFPLAGPASLELSLQKTDPKLNQIRFEGKWISPKGLRSSDKYAHDIMLSMSTPGTTIQRELKMDLKITRDKNGFFTSFRTPSKKVIVEGSLVDETDLKRGKILVNIDDKSEYSVKADIQIDRKTYATTYRPSVEISIPNRKSITLQGSVIYAKGKKLGLDMTVKELTQIPVAVKADFEKKTNGDATANVTLNSYMLTFNAKGVLFKQRSTYSTQIDAQYRTSKSSKQYRLNINAKFNNLSTDSLTNYKTTLDTRSTQYPEYNTLLKWDHQRAAKHFENNVELRYGQDQTENNKMEIVQVLNRHEGLQATLKVTHPKNNIDFNLNLKHQTTSSSVNTNLQVQYTKGKNLGMKLVLSNLKKAPIRGEVDLIFFYPERDIRVKGKVDEYEPRQYKAEGSVQYLKGKTISFNLDFKNKTSQYKINHELSATWIPESGPEQSISYVMNSRDGAVLISAYLEKARKRIYGIESENTYHKDRMFKTISQVLLDGETNTVEASYTIKDDRKRNHEALLRLDSPKNKILGSMSVDFQGNNFYDPIKTHLLVDVNGDKVEFNSKSEAAFIRGDRKIILDANLITPFRKLRDLKLSTKYTDNGKRYNALFTTVWNTDKKIQLSLDGEYTSRPYQIEAKMQLDSPYTKDLLIQLKHRYQNRELGSLVSYSYGRSINKKLEITGKYLNDRSRDIQGSIRLTSDSNRDPDYLISFKHTGDSRREQTEAEFSQSDEKITFINSLEKRSKNSYSGEAKLETTFSKLSNVDCKYSVEYSPTKFMNKVDVSWGRDSDEKARYEIELMNNDYKKIQGKIIVLAPIVLDDQVELRMNYNNDANVLKGDLTVKWKPLKEVMVNYNINKERDHFTEGTFSFRSPFENFENLRLNAAYDNDDKYSARGKFEWAPNKRVEVKADHKNDGFRSFDTSASFKSSFDDFDDVNLKALYENSDDKYSAIGEFGWAPQKRVEIKADHKNDGSRNFETSASFRSPFEDFEDLNLDARYENSDNRHSAEGGFGWKPDKRVEVKADLRNVGDKNFETSASFRSPFEDFEDLNFDARYENSDNKHSALGGFGWQPNKRVEVKADHKYNDDSFNTMASFTSPFEDFENLKLDAKYDFDDKYSAKGGFEWAPNKKVEIKGDHKYNDYNNFDTSLSLNSKHFNINDWRAHVEVDGDDNDDDYKAKAEYRYDSKKVAIEFEHRSEQDPCNFEGSVVVETPYESFRSAKIRYEHKHEKRDNIRDKVIVEVNGREKINLEIKDDNNDKNRRAGSIVFNNPLQPFSGSYEYLSRSSSSINNYKLTGEICLEVSRCNEKSLKFEISGEKRDQVLKTIIRLERSQQRRVRYEMLLDWNNKFNGDVKLEYPERTIVLTVRHENIRRKIISSAELKWDAARNEKKRIGYRLNHENVGRDSNDEFRTDLVVLTPRKDVVLRSKYSSDDRVVANMQLECEFLNTPGKIFTLNAKLSDEAPNSVSNNNYSLTLEYICHDRMSVKLQSHIANSPERATTRFNILHQDRNQKRYNVELWGQLNKNDKTVYVLMKIPSKTIETSGSYEDVSALDDDVLKVNLETTIDGKKAGRAELLYDESKNVIDAKIYYDLDRKKMYHMYGQIVNTTFARFEAYRQIDRERINDVQAAIRLNPLNPMKSQVFWRPESISDMKEQVRKIDDYSSRAYDNIYKSSRDGISEAKNRYDLVSRQMKDSMRPSYDEVSGDARRIYEELKEHYYNGKESLDEFYSENFKELFEKVKKWLSDVAKNTKDICGDYTERTRDSYNDYSRSIRKKYDEYKDIPSKYLHSAVDNVKERYSSIFKTLCDLFKEAKEEIREVIKKVEEYYDEVRDWIHNIFKNHVSNNRFYSNMRDAATSVSDKFNDVKERTSEFIEPVTRRVSKAASGLIKNYYDPIAEHVSKYSNKIHDKYEEIKYNIRNNLERHYKELKKREEVQYIIDRYNEVVDNLELRDAVRKYYDSFYDSAAGFASDYYENNYKPQISLDLDAGKFTMSQPLFIDWKSLNTLPDTSTVTKYADYMLEKYDSALNYSVWDTFYQYKPSPDVANWVPPFKAMAMMNGQHIMTFDGEFYDFAGECSYLLASDFVDKNFTIMATYGRQGVLKSVKLMIKDTEIEVFIDNKVKVNGRQTELPYNSDGISITRESGTIVVKSSTGITLRALTDHDIYSLDMAGWYFGKTGGLFGTYDNEPNNDFMKHDRQLASNIIDFVSSWNVDESCHSSTNFAKTRTPEVDSRAYKQCVELFEKNDSPLRNAFTLEDPKPYRDMCLKDALLSQNRVDEETTYCNAAIMYVEQARNKHSVPINPPKPCVKCEHPEGKTFYETDSYKIDANAPKSADIVFVVEEKSCNEEFSRKIEELTKRLEASLNKEKLNDNRYSLVGFGGKTEPHIHTVDGELFSTDRLISKAANNIIYDNSRTPTDAFEALKIAADLPFRTGVTKIVILSMCTDCEEREMSISYGDIQGIYLEHDIDLHILKKSTLEIKGKPSLTDNIFGISATSVYTKKDDKSSVIGDKDLRKQVSVPKDICVALAQETNGTMFSSEKLYEASFTDVKTFLNVFTKAVSQDTEPAECQICDCILSNGYTGKTVCRLCQIPKPVVIEMSAYGSSDERTREETTTPRYSKPIKDNKKPGKKPNLKMSKSAFIQDDDQFFEFFADDFEWI